MASNLDFSYKYPFSDEARKILEDSSINKIDYKYLQSGSGHINESLQGNMGYRDVNIDYLKRDYLLTYVYSRLILSALKNPFYIDSYAAAEAIRSSIALSNASDDEILHVAKEVGISFIYSEKDKVFNIKFNDFLSFSPAEDKFKLVNQRLKSGIVAIQRSSVAGFVKEAIKRKIMSKLPISYNDIPNEVKEYSKRLTFKSARSDIIVARETKSSVDWIDRLLETPIPDVRHRTVNLILAPYLINVKGLSAEDSAKIINNYIERCKKIEPNTKINEKYVEYQCKYAKRRGLKPLSFERAKELLGEYIGLVG